MAYKTFVAGEEALAADVNSYLMGQTVARFASAAARTAGLTAPVLNQLSMLDSNPGLVWYWTGSAWALMPLTYERFVAAAGGVLVSSGSPLESAITTFAMPFLGTIFLNGIAQFSPGSVATVVNALMDVSSTAVPAATTTQQWIGPAMPANTYYAPVPYAYKWSAVPAGTAVQLKLKYSTNTATQLLLQQVAADVRIVPAEF